MNQHDGIAPAVHRSGVVLLAIAACLLSLSAILVTSRETTQAASATPSLVFVTRSGHSLAVVGRHWGRHVVIAARIGATTGGAVLASLGGGTFTIALDFSVACGGISVEARDYRGDDATIRRTGPLCPNRLGEPPPLVSVLQGSESTRPITVLAHPSGPRMVTMRVGDTLDITERGPTTPAFLPTADASHFALLTQGIGKQTRCGQAACGHADDHYWQWVAVKPGRATIGLSPACRQSHPVCGLADRYIDITIVT